MKIRYLFLTLFSLCLFQMGWAQQQTVTGTVTDESGMPLPGATVVETGTNNGVTTDFDGNFSLQVATGASLSISYVGYESSTQAAAQDMAVQLFPGTALEEVVVLGYNTLNRSEITGSATQVGSDQIQNFPITSADQILQGKVAGLSLNTSSGVPGSVQNILIRGRSSITASNAPLFVIDGVPVSNAGLQRSTAASTFSPLANINPDNIESITVLKDPSSTAPYGARGTNGVIVITTKKGRSQEATISLSATYGTQNDAINGPEMLTGAEREMLFYEGLFNTYGASEGFSLDQAEQYYRDNPRRFGTAYVTWNDAGRKETRWQDIITNKDAPIKTVDFSSTGGTEKVNYYIGMGYLDQEATVIGSFAKRYTGALNLDIELKEGLRLTTNNNYGYVEQDGALEQSAYFASARATKYFSPPIWSPLNEDGSYNFNVQGGNYNPLYLAKEDFHLSKVNRLTSNTSLDWETPIPYLKFKSTFSADNQRIHYKNYGNRIHGGSLEEGGQAAVLYLNRSNYVFQNSLNYKWNVADHSVNITALQEFQKNRNTTFSASGESFAADGLTNLNNAGKPTDVGSGYTDWGFASYLGLVNYNFQNKYLLNTSFRREGSSRFPATSRWGNFWSVGLGWNLHQEDFMSNASFINVLKLRSSFGTTGNAGIELNTYQASLSYDADYGGTAAVYPGAFGNSGLRWETANSFEAGFDFSGFNNRFDFTFNYYSRETTDMLQEVPLSRTTGFADQNQNIGRMSNKGLEFEFSGNLVQREDFSLSVSGNVGTNKNEVLELALDGNGEEINISTSTRRVATGHTVYEWYMVSYAGVNPDNGNAQYYVDETKTTTTENFNDAERVFQGKGAIPTLLMGLNLNLNYKGFFLNAQGNYAGGHAVWEDWTRYTNSNGRLSTQYYNGINKLLDRWQKPGDITEVPKITYSISPWRIFNRFLYDGDYFRLRDVSFGYDFNSATAAKIGMDQIRVFVRGVNLYTWVKDEGLQYDPEVDWEGFAAMTNPPTKNFIFGVNLKF